MRNYTDKYNSKLNPLSIEVHVSNLFFGEGGVRVGGQGWE